MYDQLYITDDLGSHLPIHVWCTVEKPLAVIQVAHGMMEHMLRYTQFANFFCQAGFAVIGNDHLAHGISATKTGLGILAPGESWETLVANLKRVNNYARSRFDRPVFLLGHSMGSILALNYVAKFGNTIDSLILSGTFYEPRLKMAASILLSYLLKGILGERREGRLFHAMIFAPMNKQFAPNKSSYDWLCSDPLTVQSYVADPLCGQVASFGFYHQLFRGLFHTLSSTNLSKIPITLPIHIIAGANDPLSHQTKKINTLVKKIKKAGLRSISEQFYPDGRHVILDEKNRVDVLNDLLQWISLQIVQQKDSK